MIKYFLIIITLVLASGCSPESSLLKVSLILDDDITGVNNAGSGQNSNG